MNTLLTKQELEAAIRQVGAERYHDKHPFHHLLHGGKLNKGQVQAWALNRYCYQSGVPRKDAALMSRVHDRELRREWVHRIFDHDGAAGEEGGIERWLVLTDCLGLDRNYVVGMEGALPATRFAVEAYVRFVVEQPLVVAAASSLTELFAPSIHRERIAGMLQNYDFVAKRAMQYFKRRLDQANRDADFALVLSTQGIVLARLRQSAIAATDITTVEAAMDAGPSTVRPDITATDLLKRLQGRKLTSALVTIPEGRSSVSSVVATSKSRWRPRAETETAPGGAITYRHHL